MDLVTVCRCGLGRCGAFETGPSYPVRASKEAPWCVCLLEEMVGGATGAISGWLHQAESSFWGRSGMHMGDVPICMHVANSFPLFFRAVLDKSSTLRHILTMMTLARTSSAEPWRVAVVVLNRNPV